MFSEEKLSKARQKKTLSISIKSAYSIKKYKKTA